MDTTSTQAGERLAQPSCPVGTLVATLPVGILIAPARCRRWSCDPCGKKKARDLSDRIARTPARRFLTLTLRDTPALSAQQQLDTANSAWRTLWKRWKRAYPTRCVGYVKIVELQKNGTPHLHLAIATPYISQAEISRQWAELTGSPIVDIRRIATQRGMAKYLSKYLTKALARVTARRRWSQSASFLPPPAPPTLELGEVPLEWRWRNVSPPALMEDLSWRGFIDAGHGWWHERPPAGAHAGT